MRPRSGLAIEFSRIWMVLWVWPREEHGIVKRFACGAKLALNDINDALMIVTREYKTRRNKTMKNFLKNEAGQGMVEYGLIIALIAVVVIAAVTTLGKTTNGVFGKINNGLK